MALAWQIYIVNLSSKLKNSPCYPNLSSNGLGFIFQIISGQHLPRPRGSTAKGNVIDPYVVIQLHGIPADCTGKEYLNLILLLQSNSLPLEDQITLSHAGGTAEKPVHIHTCFKQFKYSLDFQFPLMLHWLLSDYKYI